MLVPAKILLLHFTANGSTGGAIPVLSVRRKKRFV